MSDHLQLNLGALRSDMALTLHTHHAARVWHGRAASEGKPAIIGLNGFISIMNRMKQGAEQDDPWSDWWMLRIEEKLDETRETLRLLREQTDQALSALPATLSMGENLNIHPVRLPLYINAQLGFMAVYLLAEFDELARRLILAHHTALLDRSTLERWLNEGAHALRSLFSLAQQYRYSGVRREDIAARNAAARAAEERFGALPPVEILRGEKRSRFAPPLRQHASVQPDTPPDPSDDASAASSADGNDEEDTHDIA